ncbi:YdeI/OmpD-associated family protein [Cellulomonas composti]|uniref:OmdA domain containing protein n=1 Tax=Cellulomonas composti TaxID=266130 RepID=A0A511J795_9CELL|nr:YdeI/OmpD-associated family protein [Cellulomonas composti]GEL93583.1 hypothetical protein CCO02nite_02410 [Cellulomonas composti]
MSDVEHGDEHGGQGEAPPLVVADAAAWRAWLDEHEGASDGVWLVLAKKGTVEPTSLTYDQALEEALCSGWIDGQRRSLDVATFRQRYTPRRRRSIWSQRNVALVARLVDEGRMRPRGATEVEQARADGRWDRAYAGSASATVPADLEAALAADPVARVAFDALDSRNRFAVLHRVTTAPSPTSRAGKIDRLVAMLARGEVPYPPT